MFYITISNGLLQGDHQERMGAAVWQFMWLIDKVTKIDEQGWGWVLGGKPINLSDIGPERTVSRNLKKLKKEGYITIRRTPYGIVIKVAKAKKRFATSGISNTPEVADHQDNSGVSNIRQGNKDNISKTLSVAQSANVGKFIDAFKEVNPAYTKFFANKSQRAAAKRMLDKYPIDMLLRIVALLPQTNPRPYFPTITTPIQFEDKFASLEAALRKEKAKSISKLPSITKIR